MKKPKKKSKSKGSSSILVILIVLTIILFTVINMLTVYTSYKISQKNLSWTKEYYELDSKAQIFANSVREEIDKYEFNTNINTASLIDKIYENIDSDKLIIINDEVVKKPIDKSKKIVQNNHIKLEVYFYNKNYEKAFYIDLKIPHTRGEKPYEVLSWSRLSHNFEYKENPVFNEGGLIDIQ